MKTGQVVRIQQIRKILTCSKIGLKVILAMFPCQYLIFKIYLSTYLVPEESVET